MTISKEQKEAFVWIWLPHETQPVVAGKLTRHDQTLLFNYGQSYLARDNAIPIYAPELPLQKGVLPLLSGMTMPSCIRDASPDSWGRRVIINKKLGSQGPGYPTANLDELTYLLESNSDRIGALDFQQSPTHYEPRVFADVSVEDLLDVVEKIERGIPVSGDLDQALNHGTSIGGARPKAFINDGNKKYIAKFSSSTDIYSCVKAEFIAMDLARLAGLNVAPVSLVTCAHKDVLLIERFDRVWSPVGWQRKCMVSALTLLELDEMMARYASYENLAEIIRFRFTNASLTLKELFSRISFNILTGNTDDHARNHAAFWDGNKLTLTPAYDICPQGRTGNEASQAMLISNNNRMSKLSGCLKAASIFLLSPQEARAVIDHQLDIITTHWDSVCDKAELSHVDKKLLWHRQFLNPFALEGF